MDNYTVNSNKNNRTIYNKNEIALNHHIISKQLMKK